jgi:hypothetical protein
MSDDKLENLLTTLIARVEALAPKQDTDPEKDQEEALRTYIHKKVDALPIEKLMAIKELSPYGKPLPAPPKMKQDTEEKPPELTEEELKMKKDAEENPFKYADNWNEGFRMVPN